MKSLDDQLELGLSADDRDETASATAAAATAPPVCGSVAPTGCWCDTACDDVGDCCADVHVCT